MKIDYNVIRGLAYYTGPVFEAFDKKGEFRAIAGGGRYDNLVKLISGGKVELPGLGFGMGDVVLTELLKERGLLPPFDGGLDAFCLIEDVALRADSLKLIHDLRAAGLAVDYPLTPSKPDKQFKRATIFRYQERDRNLVVYLAKEIQDQELLGIENPYEFDIDRHSSLLDQ